MSIFHDLFGVKTSEIKKVCVIAPFLTKDLTKGLGVDELVKGRAYSTGQAQHFSFIYSRMGSPLIGDCILYLKDTPCTMIILIGACGAVKKTTTLDIGSLVLPNACFAMESFSSMLTGQYSCVSASKAEESLITEFIATNQDENLLNVTCASVGSLKLEYSYMDFFEQKGIDVVDMECSALFNAAKHAGKKALALLYVTDIISDDQLFAPLNPEDQRTITAARTRMTSLVSRFTAKKTGNR